MQMNIPAPVNRGKRPSLTPLIDIVFLLIIFFLLTSALASDRFKVELPSSESTGNPNEDAITVIINSDHQIAIANNTVDREDLATSLRQFVGADPASVKLMIKADAGAEADDLLDIIEAAKEVGVRSLKVATTPQ
jgi:biopolymer transport protein ExbD